MAREHGSASPAGANSSKGVTNDAREGIIRMRRRARGVSSSLVLAVYHGSPVSEMNEPQVEKDDDAGSAHVAPADGGVAGAEKPAHFPLPGASTPK